MRGRMGVAAAALAALMAAGAVWADGDTRPATAAEKAFVAKAYKALCESMPPPPAGWRLAQTSEPPSLTAVAGSGTVHPIEVYCEKSWEDQARLQAAQARMLAAYQSVKPDPALQAKADELEKRQAALIAAMTQAAQKGDQAKMQEIQKQLDPVGKEYQKVMEAQSQGFVNAAKAGEARDATLRIHAAGNRFYEYLPNPVKEAPVGGAAVYRVEASGSDSQEGTTWAFLGPWRASDGGGGVTLRADEKGGSTALCTVVVRIQAEKARARAALDKVNWAGLKALLAH